MDGLRGSNNGVGVCRWIGPSETAAERPLSQPAAGWGSQFSGLQGDGVIYQAKFEYD